MSKQTIFPIIHIEKYLATDFIVSSSNQEAYNAIINWPNNRLVSKLASGRAILGTYETQNPSISDICEDLSAGVTTPLPAEVEFRKKSDIWGIKPYDNSLLIIGPESSGKTFLAHIWRDKGKDQQLNSRQKIIEDIDSGLLDEEKLLHIFNNAREENQDLLLTASKFPKFQLLDLASRINSLNKIYIGYPDDELIKMLIFKLFSNYSTKVSQEVISYLMRVLPREFVTIHKTIENINQVSLSTRRKITIPFLKDYLQRQNYFPSNS